MNSRLRPSARPRATKTLLLSGVVAALVLAAGTGCGESKKPVTESKTPAQVLALAKKHFDDAKSVTIELSTKSMPTSGNAVLGADGAVVHPASFKGNVKVLFSGLTATVPITAIGGKVYAKMPMQANYAEINPSEYGAPDPAQFADPDTGLSALLTKMEQPKKGKQVRQDETVLTSYSGVLPGGAVKAIIPSASVSKDYQTTIGIDKSGFARTVKVTGVFFAAKGDVTYDVVFDSYGKDLKITAP